MNTALRRSFRTLPSMVVPYFKVAFSRKPLFAVEPPATTMEFEARHVTVDTHKLQRYRKVCGIPPAPFLPPTYLHVLAMPLHMRVFTAPTFPVKVVGLVQLHNVIRQYAPIPVDATLRLYGGFNRMTTTERGQEYELLTRCEMDGATVWEEVSTMLARDPTASGKRPRAPRPPKDAAIKTATLAVAEDIGRRYAGVSGDVNPIHLYARTARWFKFKQAVSHGMWSLARCLGEVAADLPPPPFEIETQFQFPIFLPSVVNLQSWSTADGLQIRLSDERGLKPHITMEVRPLTGTRAGS